MMKKIFETLKPGGSKTAKKRSKGGFKNHPFVIPVTTLLLLFLSSMVLLVVSGGSTIAPSDRKIVRLSIDGEQESIPTRAKTVGDLVERLKLDIDEQDIVEPALDSPIDESDFSVNIYNARPVVIVDKDTGEKTVAVTAAPEPRQAVKDAGIKVYPEDIVTAETNPLDAEDVIREGFVVERIVVDRAVLTEVNLYGNNIKIRTHLKTVGDVLAARNIQTLSDDVITPALDTPIAENTKVFITRVGSEVETVEETIPAPVEIIEDPTMAVGSETVREAGSDGKKVVTYEVRLENGVEVARDTLQEVISDDPITRVVVRGTKVVYSNPSANVELGQQIAADMGWSQEFSCIYQIFQRESGWNHLARNSSSGAYGIPQALPGSKMGPGWQSDPAVQIRWGIGYMVGRYGSPCGANAFWNQNHWY